MSGFVCPRCGETTEIFKTDGGRRLAETYQVPFLGKIPIDPAVGDACDTGIPFLRRQADSATTRAMQSLVDSLLRTIEKTSPADEAGSAPAQVASQPKTEPAATNGELKIAVPVADGKLNLHFGHCEAFVLLRVDPREKKILATERYRRPAPRAGPASPLAGRARREPGDCRRHGRAGPGPVRRAGDPRDRRHPCESPETLVRQYLDETLHPAPTPATIDVACTQFTAAARNHNVRPRNHRHAPVLPALRPGKSAVARPAVSADADGTVRATFQADSRLQGYDGILHGGVISALLDAAMTHCLWHHGVEAVTGDLRGSFVASIPCDARVEMRAWIASQLPPLYRMKSEIRCGGEIAARADAKFMQRGENGHVS